MAVFSFHAMSKIYKVVSLKTVSGIIIFLLCLLAVGSLGLQSSSFSPEPSSPSAIPPKIKSIKIVAVGDIMAHLSLVNSSFSKEKKYDFVPAFNAVRPIIQKADIAIGNLETLFVNKQKISGYPKFNSPSELARDLKSVGFDLLTTANNHSLDYGEKGILDTLNTLKKYDIKHAGTSSSSSSQDHFAMIEKNGIKIAVMAYTCKTNGHKVPKGKNYLLNIYSKEYAEKEVLQAKKQKADLLISYIHFGEEYERFPNPEQYEVVNELETLGFNIIIGSHPHVLQPEKNNIESNRYAIFSLGNFISGQRTRFTDIGMILEFEIQKHVSSNRTYIHRVNHIPTFAQNKKGIVSVVPLKTVEEKLTKVYAQKLTYNKQNMYKDVLGHVKGGVYLD